MVAIRKRHYRIGFGLTLILCLLLCSCFITIEPIDAEVLDDYTAFSLDNEIDVPFFQGQLTQAPFPLLNSPEAQTVKEIQEMPVYSEVLQDDLQDVDNILAEIARKKAEEAARRAREAAAREAARKAAEKKAAQEAANAGLSPSRTLSYTIREINGYTETEYLAALCFIEAGNQYEGSLAVANVVLNRLESSRFPNTIYDVIYQKNQFAVGRINSILARGSYSHCLKAVQDALSGYNNIGTRCYFNAVNAISDARKQLLGDYVIIGGNCFYH